MKLIMLTYLEGDEKCVERLLTGLEVPMFSRLAVEGHERDGAAGWYGAGSVAPYRSEVIFVFASDALAETILESVRECTGVEDPKHPIRAFALEVESAAACGCEAPAEALRSPPRTEE
jgi:hypothetical protein